MKSVAMTMINSALLGKILCMPEDMQIIGAEWDFPSDNLRLYVQCDRLPTVPLGHVAPLIHPEGVMSLLTKPNNEKVYTYTLSWDVAIQNPSMQGLVVSGDPSVS